MTSTWDALRYLMKHERDAKVFMLLTNKKKSFSTVQKESGIEHDTSLTRVLHRLSSHGLAYHVYVERRGTRGSTDNPGNPSNPGNFYSLYEATPVGKEILKLYEEMETIAKEYDVKISKLADMPISKR